MTLDDRVTKNFSLSEFVESDTATRLGIDNTPPPEAEHTLRNVLIPAMQSVRDMVGVPVVITSGYRCQALNEAVRGSVNSDHLTGHACDFRARMFGSPKQVALFLAARIKFLKFDQLIWEGSWVHISFGTRLRNEVLTAHFNGGGVRYTQGIA
jgi:hypothetical protein